jgi:flagellar hook assembly protein FlgD
MLALLAGTTTAFALTEVLKLEGSPIARPKYHVAVSPVCDCPYDTAWLPVKLRKKVTFDAAIVDSDGNVVQELAVPPGPVRGRVLLRWDGRDDSGAVVSDGSYRLRLTFGDADRTIVVPNEIRVDTKAPTVALESVSPQQLVPAEGSIRVVARSNEESRLVLLVDGKRVARGPLQGPGTLRLTWEGTLRGKVLGPGTYTLTVAARDRAGNISNATPGVAVEIVRAGG